MNSTNFEQSFINLDNKTVTIKFYHSDLNIIDQTVFDWGLNNDRSSCFYHHLDNTTDDYLIIEINYKEVKLLYNFISLIQKDLESKMNEVISEGLASKSNLEVIPQFHHYLETVVKTIEFWKQ